MENKNRLNILYVSYEEMKRNPEEVVSKLQSFVGLPNDEEAKKRAIERSSFEFMKKYEDKFGIRPERKVYDNFIRKGRSGEWQTYFSNEHIKEFELQHSKYFEKS